VAGGGRVDPGHDFVSDDCQATLGGKESPREGTSGSLS